MIAKADYNIHLEEVYDIVNTAYMIEVGTKGLASIGNLRWPYHIHSEEVRKEMGYMLVYIEDGHVRGCVKTMVDSEKVFIATLAVDLTHQKRGIASKLLTYAENLAPIAQLEALSCRTDLLPFYDKRGYKEVHRQKATEKFKSTKVFMMRKDVDCILLEKRRSP